MWIYVSKALTIVTSLLLLKLILGAENLNETRIYLIAFAVAGALSLLEFGLGDHLLQQARAGKVNNGVASNIRKLIYSLLAASGLSIGIISFIWPKISLEMISVLGGIFLYSIVNVLLGVHQKVAFVIINFKSSYLFFSCATLIILLSALIGNVIFESILVPVLIILYGSLVIACIVINDFVGLSFSSVNDEVSKKPHVGRAELSLENILNSLTLMLVGINIAALPSKEEVALFSIYARVANVVAMFGMIYVLTIWQDGREDSLFDVTIRYLISSLLIMVTLSVFEISWIHLFVSNFGSQISLSLLIATSLILWRILGDLVSQISKFKSIAWVVICNAIVQCLLVTIGLGANYINIFSLDFLVGLFVMGWIVSGAFLVYVFTIKGYSNE
jgi:hypothetical protein